MPHFRLYSFRGQPVLAVPRRPAALRRQAIERYPVFTTNRARWRKWMLRAQSLHLTSLLGRTCSLDHLDSLWPGLAPCLDAIETHLNLGRLQPVIAWPSSKKQHRLYAFAFIDGGPTAFVKLSRHDKDRFQFQRERDALERLRGGEGLGFKAPRVLSFGTCGEVCYLATTMTPATLRPAGASWAELRPLQQRYSGPIRHVPARELVTTGELGPSEFTPSGTEPADEPWLRPLLDEPDRPIAVCAVHGDLQPNNVMRDGDDLWLIDWERAAKAAPVLVDGVSYFKSRHRALFQDQPDEGYARLCRFCQEHEPKADALDIHAAFVYHRRRGDGTSVLHPLQVSQDALLHHALSPLH
ncbi:MAG: phosphotransferase [Phycisphaeraceae bacterium]